jgi:WD40 repeat protein/serine/threonine protein kinase
VGSPGVLQPSPPTGPPGSPLIGRSLGDFKVLEQIGAGGFGTVYLAEQSLLGRQVVIKTLRTRDTPSQENVQRFLREAQLASRLQHPCAAHVYAFGAEEDGTLWLAMELVRGTALDAWLKRDGPLPLPRFVALWQRLCEVVHSAHEQGIIHRDIKAANVMIVAHSGRLWPKLLDLGVARWVGETAGAVAAVERPLAMSVETEITPGPTPEGVTAELSTPTNATVTRAGAIVGTPHYMSPEQWINPSQADARTDIYSLGILAYQCLTGSLPFEGTTLRRLARDHAQRPLPQLPPSLPEALNSVLARATAKDAGARFASALELAQAIEAASGLDREPPVLDGLDDEVCAEVIALAPQPIADAMGLLESARSATQARQALKLLVHATVRYLALCALACRSRIGPGSSADTAETRELLVALRESGLHGVKWLALSRALLRPFASRQELFPIPQLLGFFFVGSGADQPGARAAEANLSELIVEVEQDDAGFSSRRDLARLSQVLRDVSFLWGYVLAVGSPRGGERWVGVGRRNRLPAQLEGPPLRDGEPALIDESGSVVVSLWPFAQVLFPNPGAPEELFALTGPGRHGAKLTGLSVNFERQAPELWSWFDAQFGTAPGAHELAAGLESSPYRGLSSFRAQDAENFFGREVETEEFSNRLRAQGFVVVVGPSGAGKSSFVQAGVIPALGAGWRSVVVRPGASPVEALVAALHEASLPAPEPSQVRARPAALAEALGDVDGKLLLLIDQFEELLTLCPDPGERAAYAEALVTLADQVPQVRVVATLRDDFLIRLQQLPSLRRRMAQSLHLLGTPEQADLVRILTEPARRAGFSFDAPALPEEMVREVAQQTGALALLSFTASKLWELRDRYHSKLTRAAYTSLGGVGGALARHAEATIQEIEEDQQPLIREAFRALVTADGTRAVVTRPELIELLGSGAHAQSVLERLIQARLLVTSEAPGAGGDRVEIIHETLLSSWPRLVRWQREDAENARLRDQLRAAARQWTERGRPKGVLWRKEALAEYRLWRTRYRGALTATEREFGDASLREEARGIRLRRTLVVTAMVSLVIGLIVLFRAQRRAELGEAEARAQVATAHAEQGRQLALQGRPLAALAYLVRSAEEGLWNTSVRYLLARCSAALNMQVRVLSGPGGELTTLAQSPGSQWLAAGGRNGEIDVWEAATGRLVHVLTGHTDQVVHLQFSPDSTALLSSSRDRTARVWDVGQGIELRRFPLGAAVSWASYSGDGKVIAAADMQGHVETWQAADGGHLASAHPWETSSRMALSPDGSVIAVIPSMVFLTSPYEVALVDGKSGAALTVLKGFRAIVTALAIDPGGTRLAASSEDSTVRIFSLPDGAPLLTLEGHAGPVRDVAWSAAGDRLATASSDGTARIWNAESGKMEHALTGHVGPVRQVLFSSDGALVFTVGDDRTLRAWNTSSGTLGQTFQGHLQTIVDLVETKSGQLASASADGTVRFWQPRAIDSHQDPGMKVISGYARYDGQGIVLQGEHRESVAFDLGATLSARRFPKIQARGAVSLAPVFGKAAVITSTRSADIVDARSGEVLYTYRSKENLKTLCWSWDEQKLVFGFVTGHYALLDLVAHTEVELMDRGVGASFCTFRPDGTEVLLGDAASTLTVWNFQSRAPRLLLKGHSRAVLTARYSLNGDKIATGSEDGTAIVWDAASGRIQARFEEHRASIPTLSFSPEGTLLATGSEDATVKVWDISRERGPLLDSFQLSSKPLAVAFGSDGQTLYAATREAFEDWDVGVEQRPLAAALASIRSRMPFALTPDGLLIIAPHDQGLPK